MHKYGLVFAGLCLLSGLSAAEATSPATAPAPTKAITACGKPVQFKLDEESFSDFLGAKKATRLATIKAKLPPLIASALDDLCAKKVITPATIEKRVKQIVIQDGQGADEVAAYFPDDKASAGQLVVQWNWNESSSVDIPKPADIKTGLQCGFKPTDKVCAGREP